MQGLIKAVKKVLPQAEHRWCARHIYANWSKKWRGEALKKNFWICAWSTFDEEFKDNLKKLGELSKSAASDLLKYAPHNWCRAYFSSRSKCNMVDNNIAECFNSWIKEARHKAIVSMLEEIRLQCMNRIRENKHVVLRWKYEFSPSCISMYQDNKEGAEKCVVVFHNDVGFEVQDGEDKHTVLLDKKQCTCRAWDLTGIPCCHVIRALYHLKKEPMNEISAWYSKKSYLATYETVLQPVPGKRFMKVDEYLPIEPPKVEKMPGRPRKKRIRAENESNKNARAGKLTKKGQQQKCGICRQEGHNRVGCPKNNMPSSRRSNVSHNTTQNSQVSRVSTVNQSSRSYQRGYGCMVDEQTGAHVLDPGLTTQRTVTAGIDVPAADADTMTRFPIPNERELMRNRTRTSTITNTRKINFTGDGSEVTYAAELPFSPTGLQWNGGPCITSRQLQQEREAAVGARHYNSQNSALEP